MQATTVPMVQTSFLKYREQHVDVSSGASQGENKSLPCWARSEESPTKETTRHILLACGRFYPVRRPRAKRNCTQRGSLALHGETLTKIIFSLSSVGVR